MMKLSIRFKLLVGFIIVLGVSYTVQAVSYRANEQAIRKQLNDILSEKAENAADEVANFFTRIERDQLGISRTFKTIEDEKSDANLELIITHTLRQNEFFNKISILAPSGRELIKVDRFGRSAAEDLGFEIPTAPFNIALTGKTGISKVFFAEQSPAPQLNVFSPIFSDNGSVIGIVKSQLTLDRLWYLIAQIKLGKRGFAYIVDEEGRLIAHPDSELVLKGPNFSSRKIISRLLSETKNKLVDSDYFYINEKNEEVLSNGVKIPALGWIMVVEQPVNEAFSQLESIRYLYFTTLIGSIVLLVVISFILSENFTRPIERLRAAAELMEKGNLGAKVEIKSNDEMQELAEAFNLMAKKLKQAIGELQDKVKQLEVQKQRLDITAKLLLRRDLDIREFNDELEREKDNIMAERNKLQVIISGISDAVIAIDLERRIIIFNKAAEELIGYSPEEVLGKSINEVIKLFDNNEELNPNVYSEIRQKGFEGVVYKKEDLKLMSPKNKDTYVNLISATIKEGAKANLGCILTLHDVGKEHELEEMKLDFVSMAAHELRTPLTAIRGYATFLLKEVGQEFKEDVKNLAISADQLGILIDNLLSVSRIERGAFKVEMAPCDLDQIIKSSVEDFIDQAQEKKLDLSYEETKVKKPVVFADRFRIKQVMSNLLTNAVTYTNPGGKIKISLSVKDKSLVVAMKDTGIGIPMEALPKLFTKFFRVSGPLKEGAKGTGLGLFISKEIINQHQGEIWVESELGKGSTFSFSIPIANQKELKEHDAKKLQAESWKSTEKPGVMINKKRANQLRTLSRK